MAVFKALKELKDKTENQNQGAKKSFVNLESGKSIRIRFLQEIAMDGKNYSEERGVAQVIPIHRNPAPNMFKKQAACSMESEGQCWACEQITDQKESYKWRAKNHLLINVAVLENEEWVPKILDQTFFSSHVGSTIVEMAEEFGTIMNHEYKFSKKGQKLETEYSLLPLSETKEPKQFADFEIVDLSEFKKVPYINQESFYLGGDEEPAKAAESW